MDQKTLKAIAKLCEEQKAGVVPYPVLGDEDSIHLTEFQEGEKYAYTVMKQLIEAML